MSYPLDHDEYQRNKAQRYIKQSRRWFPDLYERSHDDLVIHFTLGLAGEVGELVNLVKKANRSGDLSSVGTESFADELADIYIYLSELAEWVGIDLIAAADKKERKLYERWGNPWSAS